MVYPNVHRDMEAKRVFCRKQHLEKDIISHIYRNHEYESNPNVSKHL